MLERYELETFLTLAEELHFGRTAARLHVSAARVSQTVAGLERRIGVALFHRTSRRVELSPVGRRLYEEVRPAWSQIADAYGRAVDAGRGLTGLLRVGFDGPAAGQLLVEAARLFRDRHPECEVRSREVRRAEIAGWLRDDVVDVALTRHPLREDGVTTGPVLVREARMLAVPKDHPLARRPFVAVEDLDGTTVLRGPESLPTLMRDDCERTTDFDPTIATIHEVLTRVGAGDGVFPVSAHVRRYFARPDVVYVPIPDAEPVEWGLVWRVDGATARVRAFSEAALDVVRPDRGA